MKKQTKARLRLNRIKIATLSNNHQDVQLQRPTSGFRCPPPISLPGQATCL